MEFSMRKVILLFGLLLVLFNVQPSKAGVPEVANLFVTDVTTVSFSVIWASSEASTADLEVFSDINGSTSPAGINIIPHPVGSGDQLIRAAAEDNGVMKVMVTGLEADTTYYFRTVTTSKSTTETSIYPENELMSVATENQTARTHSDGGSVQFFSNDMIIEPCYLADGVTPAEGTLLVGTAAGGHYPITSFVGDGVALPYARIDLNNIFGRDSNRNFSLAEGQNLTLVNFRGMAGNAMVTCRVPTNNSLGEIKAGESFHRPGRNLVSLQLEPANNSIAEVFNSIIGKLISLWAFDVDQSKWVFFVKDGPGALNELNDIQATKGFWMYLNDTASIKSEGSFTSEAIFLKSGRNLVGFNSIETLPVLDAISSIDNEIISIWTFDTHQDKWIFYVKEGLPFLNELTQVEPGKAYWIYVNTDCYWQKPQKNISD